MAIKTNTKATITSNGFTVKVEYAGRMSYYITVDGIAIECFGNLGQAVARANKVALLGRDELKLRQQYAMSGIETV